MDDEEKKLRIVVAVGGNALQRRGDRLTIENQMKAAASMAPTMSELCKKHQLGTKIRRVYSFSKLLFRTCLIYSMRSLVSFKC